MPDNGKLEAQHTVVGGGGWSFTYKGNLRSIAEGAYYLSSTAVGGSSSLIAAFQTELQAVYAASYVSISAGEGGTGKVSINSDASFTLTWGTGTTLRDALGFTGDLSGITATSTNQAKGLWLPDNPYQTRVGGSSWRGWDESDFHTLESPGGYVYAVMGQRKTVNAIRWPAISKAKTWASEESTTNESFQTFWREGVLGEAAWGTAGGPVRFHPDADTDGTYGEYKVVQLADFNPPQYKENWDQYFPIDLPRLVEVPS